MNNKRKIYIILSYTGSIFSVLLRQVLKTQYVHVSIGMDKEFKKVYSFGRKYPRIMFPCGFVNEDIQAICHVFNDAKCQVFELEIEENQYKDLEAEIATFIANKDEYGYNICGLIPLKFNISWPREKHFVCSQFVGKVLKEAGIYKTQKSYSLLKPKDFLNMDNLKKIYEGEMKNLPCCL